MFIVRNKRLHNGFRKGLILPLSILIYFSLLLSGCGKKAPPIPSRQAKLPPVVDGYNTSIKENMLIFARNIPTEKEMMESDLCGFIACKSEKLFSK
jgi:hypothetical protein